MIDTHCHIDMFPNPLKEAKEREKEKFLSITMTNLPSHYELGYLHLQKFRYIRMALGLHPLRAKEHKNEYSLFKELLNNTSYIGEVGLDYSREGYETKTIQNESLRYVFQNIQNKKKIVSLHSRNSEKDVFALLLEYNIHNAIFHWYSGSQSTLRKIIEEGYYFSINTAMVKSEKGKKIIAAIPPNLILTETDAPYIDNMNVKDIYKYLSSIWNFPENQVENIIYNNFMRIIDTIKSD